jgi:hypothetical protein
LDPVKEHHSLETWHALAEVDPLGTFDKLTKTLELEFSTAQLILSDCEGSHRTACEYMLEKFKDKLEQLVPAVPPRPVPPPATPPASKGKITIGSVLGFIFMCCLLLVAYGFVKDTILFPLIYSSSPRNTPPTSRPIPTITPRPINVARTSQVNTDNSCIPWSEVTAQMAGKTVCVYGTIYQITSSRETYSRYEFTAKPNSFFMFTDGYFYHPDTGKNVVAGDCIVDTEKVQTIEGIPYIDVGKEILFCESWMK